MRIRLGELLKKRGLTPYGLAKLSGGRISFPMVYRLVRRGGRFTTIRGDVLDALCDVLQASPGDLLQRDSNPKTGR